MRILVKNNAQEIWHSPFIKKKLLLALKIIPIQSYAFLFIEMQFCQKRSNYSPKKATWRFSICHINRYILCTKLTNGTLLTVLRSKCRSVHYTYLPTILFQSIKHPHKQASWICSLVKGLKFGKLNLKSTQSKI